MDLLLVSINEHQLAGSPHILMMPQMVIKTMIRKQMKDQWKMPQTVLYIMYIVSTLNNKFKNSKLKTSV